MTSKSFEMPLPLPDDSGITTQWLEQMLCHKFDKKVKVSDWSKTFPENRQGFLSEICFVDVNYIDEDSKDCRKKLVFKFLPREKHLQEFMAAGQLDEREMNFYKYVSSTRFQDVLAKSGIPNPIPNVYFCSKSSNNLTLVMENLTTFNYKTVIIRDGSTLEQTKSILRSVAAIHAAGFLCMSNNEPSQNIQSYYNNDFYDVFLIPNLKTLSEMFKDTELSNIFLELIPITKKVRTHKSEQLCLFKTIIHGDMWAGQCLLSQDESSACVLDWQFCEFGNPVMDIVSMFFMSTDPQVIENDIDDILHAYRNTLLETIENAGGSLTLPYDEFKRSVLDNLLTGFLFIAVSLHDFKGSDNISEKRIRGLMNYLHKMDVFDSFLKQANKNN